MYKAIPQQKMVLEVDSEGSEDLEVILRSPTMSAPGTPKKGVSLAQQAQSQTPTTPASSSPSTVRRRLSRFRSPGKQPPKGQAKVKAARGAQHQHQHQQTPAAAVSVSEAKAPSPAPSSQASSEKDNGKLRDHLLAQLGLIQRQSDAIVRKDRELRELQRENEALRKKIRRMEFTGGAAPADPGLLAAKEPFFVLQGEDWLRRERKDVAHILAQTEEVPAWRQRVVPPSHALGQGQEEASCDDEAVLRRHGKLELDEKRRKRWDIQRIREQRQVQRLKARYEKRQQQLLGGGGGSGAVSAAAAAVESVGFDPLAITHIHVADELPVCAFGAPLPAALLDDRGEEEMEFELPWKEP